MNLDVKEFKISLSIKPLQESTTKRLGMNCKHHITQKGLFFSIIKIKRKLKPEIKKTPNSKGQSL